MQTEMTKLTLDKLKSEYDRWQRNYRNSRNNLGIRFGQHIHINYSVTHLFPLGVDGIPLENDGFYIERADQAYEIFLKKLA